MDLQRREVFVEGATDRLFLNWVTDGVRTKHSLVQEIDSVEVPTSQGGARGRLIEFARYTQGRGARILVLADADTDRVLERPLPTNVILTDLRDMEGYVLQEECLDKVLRLGLANERIDARGLLKEVIEAARVAGAIRLVSEVTELNLPFQQTRIDRYTEVRGASLTLDVERYVRALLQNGDISIKRLPSILAQVQQVPHTYTFYERDLIHGKDAVRLLEKVLRQLRVREDEARRLLLCSFEREWADQHPNLMRVVTFLAEH